MPVIIHKDNENLWLNPEEKDTKGLLSLLRPYNSEEMNYYSVSTLVNSPANDSPDCINPVEGNTN
jgi:putative SOS response-associated peptidase YedK